MKPSRFTEFRFARRFRTTNRLVQIILSLSLIIALNFISANYFKRIDLTKTGAYTLAPESMAYIRQLTEPVEIIVTIPKESDESALEIIRDDLNKLLREYEFAGMRDGKSYISVEFVDIYRQRKRAQELATNYNLTKENAIIIASGDKVREISQVGLYEYDNGKERGFRGEQIFTSAILDVSTKKPQKIYFLVGHGEMRLDDVDALRGLSQLESFLRERSFELATLDLAVEENVPEDASLIVVPSPQASLQPEEVEKLRRYMSDRNGRMIALIDPGRLHGMTELFYDWGVLTEDTVVIDTGTDYRAQGGDLIIRRFADHPITKLLIDYQITALFGLPRSVRIDPASVNDSRLQVYQLIGTSENSWAERDYRTQNPAVYDEKRDQIGPVSIATVSSRSSGTELGITIPGGRMIVFGNSDFIANNRLRAFGNHTLFINSINWTLDRTSLLNIPTRKLESHQIVMSESDLQRMLTYFAGIPAIAAVLGLFVFLIRRN
ncbi:MULTISPECIES: GldG family protein [unclassified Lentimonas]|uniref:GldG family protein n=1 Tax=unclassified Lentimonas TaxID=2630993 RepID=UPI0013299C4E|nr:MULTISPECIES: GldG family protein [unclassified Lentimonas]CAA6677395.1 Mucin 2 precursor [Lentimonas sp. CC4]CAA6686940.1 Mucin 2 precursor [Lentimonas sp. CC6]CAA7074641.1 Mucin 2 precursor [Lentimonas sp. CC4]CAA7169262.1 Mucin 2 precursor [Lentimonas sp. CC21]CAA7180342.1 Mucin 2 precursor [Lentimonas sp. CC8]